jgi:hypothetical protein
VLSDRKKTSQCAKLVSPLQSELLCIAALTLQLLGLQ